MKNILKLIIAFITLNSYSQLQQVNFGNNTPFNRTEWFIPNSPTSMVGNRDVRGWIKAYEMFYMKQDSVRFDALIGTGDRFVYTDDLGTLYSRPFTDFYLSSNPNGFISSFTELDPTVPNYSKSLSSFNNIKTDTDLLYYPLLGNPSGFLTSIPDQSWTSITGKPIFSTVSTSGDYNDLINKPVIKRQETYSGTTNSNGNYTVVFSTSYALAPNIQVNLIGSNIRDVTTTTVSTTGFTINVQRRTDVIGLLPSYSNVNGTSVDVLITQK